MSTELPRPRQEHKITALQQLELQMVPQRVVDHLSFPVKDYGFKSYEGFENSLDKSLKTKNKPHVLVLIGEPNSGKSRFKRDIVGDLKHQNTLEVNFGDIIKLAKLLGPELQAANPKYVQIPVDANYEDLDAVQMAEVTSLWEEFVASLIEDYKEENVLIVAELPALAGAYVDERFYGVDLGTTALWHLARRNGSFDGLDFVDYWAVVGAKKEIRDKANRERVKIEDASDPTHIQKVLEEEGNVIDSNEAGEIEEGLMDYASESPNLVAVDKIESAVDGFLKAVVDKGLLPLQGQLDWEMYLLNPDYRTEIIVESLAKYILQNTIRPRRPRQSVLITGNYDHQEKVKFGLGVKILNIVKDLYPEISKIKNKGNKRYVYGEAEAEAYERHRKMQDDIVSFFLKYINGNDFLDAGCGTGKDLEEIARRTQYRGYGCDISPAMLARASVKNSATALKVADLNKEFPFEEMFSCIYMHDVIHHLSKPDVFIKNAYEHLKEGGSLLIGTESETDIKAKITSIYFPGAFDADLSRYHSLGLIVNLAYAAGFNGIDISQLSYPVEITEGLLGEIRSKSYSVLGLISESDFQEGLKRLEEDIGNGKLQKVLQGYTLIRATK